METLLKILAVDDAVVREQGGWSATGQPWYFDEAKWAALRRVRADGILLGGTFERNEWEAAPQAGDIERILASHKELFAGFRCRT